MAAATVAGRWPLVATGACKGPRDGGSHLPPAGSGKLLAGDIAIAGIELSQQSLQLTPRCDALELSIKYLLILFVFESAHEDSEPPTENIGTLSRQ